MTENPVEGNPQGTGAVVPTPVSQPEGQFSQENVAELKRRNDLLEKENKSLQSGKDKRWSEYEPLLKKLSDEFGEDKIRDLQRQAVLDELISERTGQRQSVQSPVAQVVQPTATVDVQGVVSEYGLDPSDPFVAARVASLDLSKDVDKQVAQIVKDKIKQPIPTQAQAPASPRGQSETAPNHAAMERDYIAEVKKSQGNKTAIRAIQAKYQEKGLDTRVVHIPL